MYSELTEIDMFKMPKVSIGGGKLVSLDFSFDNGRKYSLWNA